MNSDDLLANMELATLNAKAFTGLRPTVDFNVADLLARMQRAIREINLNAGTPPLTSKIVCGGGVVDKLRDMSATTDAPLPAGTLTGIQIILNPALADDQWIAYDSKDRIVAMGSGGSWRVPAQMLVRDIK